MDLNKWNKVNTCAYYRQRLQDLLCTICMVLFLLFLLLFAVLWLELLDDEIPNLINIQSGLEFDYIVVGAGTAGSVLAAELSRKSNSSVLLIEAGHTFSLIRKIPLLTTFNQRSRNDWAFMSVPQKFSSKGLIDQKQFLPRGKGLGGSSQLNYLLHFDGEKSDFERWVKLGATGWNYGNMRKYLYSRDEITSCFNISNDCNDVCHLSNLDKSHTRAHSYVWKIPKNYSKISQSFEAAKLEFNHNLRFRRSKYNIHEGFRWSVYENFLQPNFENENLKIISNTLVRKIKIDNSSAKSVYIEQSLNGKIKSAEIFVKKEVILAAGAYQTPQILHLSGIGPKEVLKKIKTKQVLESPNIGLNLHDHMNLPLYVSIDVSASITVDKILNFKEILKYILNGEGHFSNFGVIGHVSAINDGFGISFFATGAIDEAALMSLSNFKRQSFRTLFPLYYNSSQEGFVVLSTCLQPFSRGTVKAGSQVITDDPLIDPNHLSNARDVNCTINAVRTAVKIISSKAFKDLGPKIHWPKIKECRHFGPFKVDFITNNPSDKYLECLLRTVGLTSHHPGGTCAMGDGENGVVDSQLRLKGIENLRIVDASILPTPVSGTPNAVLVAVAKRAAALIMQ